MTTYNGLAEQLEFHLEIASADRTILHKIRGTRHKRFLLPPHATGNDFAEVYPIPTTAIFQETSRQVHTKTARSRDELVALQAYGFD
jgi:hypothetical protein